MSLGSNLEFTLQSAWTNIWYTYLYEVNGVGDYDSDMRAEFDKTWQRRITVEQANYLSCAYDYVLYLFGDEADAPEIKSELMQLSERLKDYVAPKLAVYGESCDYYFNYRKYTSPTYYNRIISLEAKHRLTGEYDKSKAMFEKIEEICGRYTSNKEAMAGRKYVFPELAPPKEPKPQPQPQPTPDSGPAQQTPEEKLRASRRRMIINLVAIPAAIVLSILFAVIPPVSALLFLAAAGAALLAPISIYKYIKNYKNCKK